MVRMLVVAFVIGAALAVGAGFLISTTLGGAGAAKPVNQPLYNYGSR